jgi:phosphomannomutase/phosphoglucomutase
VDCGNGVAGELAPQLYKRLGCEVTELFCQVDGTFPNHHPDPAKPENLRDLITEVARGGYDVGLAFDGDGDRCGVISPDGTIIWPDRQMILYARDVLSRHPGGEIIYDVKCSRTLDAEIRKAGGKPTMWKTGHSFIKAKLRESGALLAGEMSGHTFFKERWYGFDDGLYTGARLLELLSRDPRQPAEIFQSLPNTVNTPELNLKFAEGEHYAFMQKLLERASFPDARVTTLDGLRVDFDDGFGLVRASNTTPVLVFRFEGDNDAAIARIQQRFRTLLKETGAHLTLPF